MAYQALHKKYIVASIFVNFHAFFLYIILCYLLPDFHLCRVITLHFPLITLYTNSGLIQICLYSANIFPNLVNLPSIRGAGKMRFGSISACITTVILKCPNLFWITDNPSAFRFSNYRGLLISLVVKTRQPLWRWWSTFWVFLYMEWMWRVSVLQHVDAF